MSADVILTMPGALRGLSGSTATYLPKAWVRSAAAIAAGHLALSSEVALAFEGRPAARGGIVLGPSTMMAGLVDRAAVHRRGALGPQALGGSGIDVAYPHKIAEAANLPIIVPAADAVQYMADYAIAVRSMSYGSPLSITLNFGPLGSVLKAGLEVMVGPGGLRQVIRAGHEIRPDAEGEQPDQVAPVLERQHQEALYRSAGGATVAAAAIAQALGAAGHPPELTGPLADEIIMAPDLVPDVHATLGSGVEVHAGGEYGSEDDIYFARP
ncbi:hypothetical protein [Promicromonospora sp. MEB111]|uniref:hypothetical protein n=1 Tax=Promicromonospora sp. MEB111 TaxID=3040301 RepID=UPI0025512C00|nr:hypothetical protein [Promicromonospora sp. MEB111]